MAMVHCARKDLALDEDTYRAVLEHVTGHSSCRDCTEGQLGAVVDQFRARGWKPKKQSKRSDSPSVRKVWALWGALGESGALHTPTRAALRTYCKKLVGVEEPEWMSPEQIIRVIENLKSWEKRTRKDVK